MKCKGAGNMLKLPFQFEHGLKVITTQLEIMRTGRCGQHVEIVGVSGMQILRANKNQWCHVLNKDLYVGAGITNWVNHKLRVKRACLSKKYKLLLSQPVQASGDVSPPGCLLESVVSHDVPRSESNDRACSSAGGIQDEKRFWNALVTSGRLRISHRKNDNSLPKDSSEVVARTDKKPHMEEPREKAQVNKEGKLTMYIESIGSSLELRQDKVDHASNSTAFHSELEEKMLFLESFDVDTAKVLIEYPSIVNITLENLKSLIYHLQSCELKRKDLGRILSMTPQIVGLNVENHLRPAVSFLLKEVGLSKRDLPKVISRCPRLLVTSIDNQLRPTMHFLQCLGFMDLPGTVSSNATLLTCNIQTKLIPKLQFLRTLGMSRDEAVTMALRFPAIFNYSVEKNLQPKYDYLVNVMGHDLGDLKSFPQYFGYSLQYRIQPRYEYSVQHNFKMSLPILLKLSEKKFYRHFKDPAVEIDEEQNVSQVEVGVESNVVGVAESPVRKRRKLPFNILL